MNCNLLTIWPCGQILAFNKSESWKSLHVAEGLRSCHWQGLECLEHREHGLKQFANRESEWSLYRVVSRRRKRTINLLLASLSFSLTSFMSSFTLKVSVDFWYLEWKSGKTRFYWRWDSPIRHEPICKFYLPGPWIRSVTISESSYKVFQLPT